MMEEPAALPVTAPAPLAAVRGGRLAWLRRELASCVRDPTATPRQSAAYQARQYQAVARQGLVSAAGNVITATAITIAAWPVAPGALLLVWLALLWGIGLAVGRRWQHHRHAPLAGVAARRQAERLTLTLVVETLLYVGMGLLLFGIVDERGRIAITAVLAAFIATGAWQFACLPQAAIAWIVVLCGGSALGLLALFGAAYAFLAVALGFYGVMLTLSVLVTSRMLLSTLRAETEIEHQRQLVGLLLHDFEENASDWLWETDARGRLRHVSMHLAHAVGTAPEDLVGRSLVSLLESTFAPHDQAHRLLARALGDGLARELPFRGIVVPVRVGPQTHWWSLSAKPLRDAAGGLEGWRGVGSDVTEARQREQAMTRLANVDTLTGLANRHQFGLRLAALFEAGEASVPGVLFMLDLDNFKAVNDTLGHLAGDELLQETARRLSSAIEGDALLARLGGDEFALIHHAPLTRGEAAAYGERLLAALAQPWAQAEYRIDVRASIGVAFTPGDATTAADLLKACDMALYAAKGAGRNRLCFFEPAMDAQARHKQALLGDLGLALQRDELRVHYQPQVDLANGRLVGFEALLRWQHPERGLISPLEFIPLAEECGLIVPIGAWVLTRACSDAVGWPEGLRVAVNVSAAQITGGDVGQAVAHALRHSRLEPGRLELELTESTLLTQSDAVLEMLASLRRGGVRIALDDFGTGYSSLSYLRRLPLDKIKIDRSFVAVLDDTRPEAQALAVVRTIVQLARALRFEVTAEGIETTAQRDLLRELGCDWGQGFLYARPMEATRVRDFIAGAAIEPARTHGTLPVSTGAGSPA